MKSKRILIISFSEDLHARAVAWAIRKKGHVCEEMFCADFPTLTDITLQVSDSPSAGGPVVRQATGELNVADSPFDTIWLRRRQSAWLPSSMHEGDREAATRQCNRALYELITALDGEGVFWVNDYRLEEISEQKLYQLRKAQLAGLQVPETLVSNNPDQIRAFIENCQDGTAHKLLEHVAWSLGDRERVFACYTSPVTLDDLPRHETLRLCPAIFQPMLKKEFEVRVACFGEHLAAVRIDSQADERARNDWRAGQWYIDMKPYTLPVEVAQGIHRFLRSTGLVYAALDFIVTPKGEHVFLESNPQGQFLWMEDRAGLPLLDVSADFLIDGCREFHPHSNRTPTPWAEFRDLWEGGLKDEVYKGVCERESMLVPE